MPIGIFNIINPPSMPAFTNAETCTLLVNQYFDNLTIALTKSAENSPPLISELALHLGFNSRLEFDDYQRTGEHAAIIKRAQLKIEAGYERKLYQQSATGAIFALKALGWSDKLSAEEYLETPKSLQVELVLSGPKLAGSEKDVEL